MDGRHTRLPRNAALFAVIALLTWMPAGSASRALSVQPVTSSPAFGPGDTGVITVSSEKGFSESEEPLAANPLDPAEMTTVANVFEPDLPSQENSLIGGVGIDDTRLYVTQDGGMHWTTMKLDQGGFGPVRAPLGGGDAPEFSDFANVINTDADSVWDRHGNAYFESGDIHGIHHDGEETETVWRSTDGGRTWGPPDGYVAVQATKGEHTELDRPWLVVNESGGIRDGRLYTLFETTPFVDIPPQIFEKHSDDYGVTWSPTVRVDDGIYETQWNPRNRPAVGGDGTLYVAYDRAPITDTPFITYDGPIQLVMARSTDGGATFQRAVVDSHVLRVTSPDEATSQYTEMISAVATGPGRPSAVAVAWPQAEGTSNSRILMRISWDGGRHWGPPIDVADDPASRDDQHDHVTLSWMPDGRLFVGWRDRRCCGGAWSDRYQQWVRVFDPAGPYRLLPGPTIQFSAGPLVPTAAGRGALAPDEFQGMVATRLGVSLTWSQLGPDGLDHLMFRRIPLSAFAS